MSWAASVDRPYVVYCAVVDDEGDIVEVGGRGAVSGKKLHVITDQHRRAFGEVDNAVLFSEESRLEVTVTH
jgi:hypothetical protein